MLDSRLKAAGSRHIYPSLVLVQPRKTHPCLTEILLMGRKESNQSKSCDVASESEIKPCNKIDKPLVVYRFMGNVMTYITMLRIL